MPTSRALLRSSLLALSFALPFGIVSVARAAACGDGPACPKNYECKTEEAPCGSLPCDGDDCEPVDCAGSTYSYCAPLPCTADSQCDDGMVCYTATVTQCSGCAGGSEDPGDSDAPPDAKGSGDCASTPECEEVSESGCVPKYALPCEAAADCGVGFTCEAEEECQCAGSEGSGGGSAGSGAGGSGNKAAPDAGSDEGDSADPAPPSDDAAAPDAGVPDDSGCSCQPTDRQSCSLKVLACSVDEGCPTGWTCGDNPNGVCSSSSDGSSRCSADPAKICLPPYSNIFGRDGAKGEHDSSGGVTGPGVPRDDDGEAAPQAADPSASNTEDASDSGGCAIGHVPSRLPATLGFAALALVGLLGARRRSR